MPDAAAMRDPLMDWVFEQAGGEVTVSVPIKEFAESVGLELDGAFTLLSICKSAGLVRDTSGMGNPCVLLTAAGIADVRARRQRREDPALRAATARTNLLRWFYHQHLTGVHMPYTDQFTASDDARHEGSRLTTAEVGYAAEYLAAKHLINGSETAEIRGPVCAEITPAGVDCVVAWRADVSAYLRGQQVRGSTTSYHGPVFHGSVDGAQLAWNNHTVTQNSTGTQRVAPGFEEFAKAVSDMLCRLPSFGLPDEDRQDAEAVANEVLVEVTQPEPNRGRIRRAAAALRGYLTPVAAGATLGASEGAQELARAAIEQLGSF